MWFPPQSCFHISLYGMASQTSFMNKCKLISQSFVKNHLLWLFKVFNGYRSGWCPTVLSTSQSSFSHRFLMTTFSCFGNACCYPSSHCSHPSLNNCQSPPYYHCSCGLPFTFCGKHNGQAFVIKLPCSGEQQKICSVAQGGLWISRNEYISQQCESSDGCFMS